MTVQAVLTALVLPPLAFAILALLGGLLASRARPRRSGWIAVLGAAGVLALATPVAEGLLRAPLERAGIAGPVPEEAPAAIIVLGGEAARGRDGPDVGPLTLERLRAAAQLHRRTGLPLLVTAGPLAPGEVALAEPMARTLREDFSVPVRWVEARAADTRDNAVLSVAMLRADGIGAAYLVTHAWHLARAREAFARAGFAVHPAPVRIAPPPDGRPADWLPRADHLGGTWYVLREWAGRLVYALRDGHSGK